jgi:hypothetical protein
MKINNPCVYVIKVKSDKRSKDVICKIGKSKDINQRLETIQSYCPYELQKIIVKETELCDYVEKILHHEFKHKHLRGEWFKLSKEDIDSIKELLPKIDDIQFLHNNYKRIYDQLLKCDVFGKINLPSPQEVSITRDRKLNSQFNKLEKRLIREYLNS